MSSEYDIKLSLIERLFRFIYRHIDARDLTGAVWPQPEPELLEPNTSEEEQSRFLDYYSRQGMLLALERYGFFRHLHKLGFSDFRLELHRASEGYDLARLYAKQCRPALIELVAQVGPLPHEGQRFVATGERRFLHIRWLRMHNPLQEPTPERPLLPGQDFPGLGCGRQMMALLQLICARLDLDGLVVLPERLHNAALYFKRFRFVNPELQGMLTAVLRDTRQHRLAELAWAVELGGLLDVRSGKPLRWLPAEQVLARQGPVKDYLNSADYRRRAKEALERHRFRLSSGDLALEQALGSGSGADVDDEPRIK